MPRTLLCFCLALAACDIDRSETAGGEPTPPSEVTSAETNPTSTTSTVPLPGLEVLSADCTTREDNVLRGLCDVSLNRPTAIALSIHEAETDRMLRFVSPLESTDHDVPLTLLPAGASLTWDVQPLEASTPNTPLWEGTLEVPSLPQAADLQVERETAPGAQRPWVLGNMGCEGGFVTALDPEGRVVWYEQLVTTIPGGVLSVRWTEDETLLAMVGHERLIEMNLHGDTLFEAVQGVDFTHPVHHDATRWNGWTYALHAEVWSGGGESFVVDGLTVFDDTGTLWAERSLTTWIEPFGTPPLRSLYWLMSFGSMTDWFHANGLDLNADGELLLTLRHQSTLAAFVGDPASEDFGAPLWHAVGDPKAQIPEDLTLVSAPGSDIEVGYDGPHSPRYTETGVLLFDNQASGRLDPRGLAMSVDLGSETATLEQAWSVPTTCTFQGGASPLEAGHVLISCGISWFELDGDGAIVDRVTPYCEDVSVRYPSRVEPFAAPSFVE